MNNLTEIGDGFMSRLYAVISEALEINETDINENLSIDNTPTWDSLAHLKLILSLEEKFNITIEEKHINTMLDFLSIVNTVKYYLNRDERQ